METITAFVECFAHDRPSRAVCHGDCENGFVHCDHISTRENIEKNTPFCLDTHHMVLVGKNRDCSRRPTLSTLSCTGHSGG